MSEQLPVQITALAAQQTREAEVWWRLNRTAAPKQFGKNLERAFALIASQPHVGGRAFNVKLPDVRRVYMPRIKYHVYYHVVGAPQYVEVIAIWHARRGDRPPI